VGERDVQVSKNPHGRRGPKLDKYCLKVSYIQPADAVKTFNAVKKSSGSSSVESTMQCRERWMGT